MPEPFFHCRPYRADITRAACLTNQRQAVAQQRGELKFDWIGSRTLCFTCPERDKRVCRMPAKKITPTSSHHANPLPTKKEPQVIDKKSNYIVPVNFKWQKELYRKLQTAAGKNGRTISAEIVARLLKTD